MPPAELAGDAGDTEPAPDTATVAVAPLIAAPLVVYRNVRLSAAVLWPSASTVAVAGLSVNVMLRMLTVDPAEAIAAYDANTVAVVSLATAVDVRSANASPLALVVAVVLDRPPKPPAVVVKRIVWFAWATPLRVKRTVTREVDCPSPGIDAGNTDWTVTRYFVTCTGRVSVVVMPPRWRTATENVYEVVSAPGSAMLVKVTVKVLVAPLAAMSCPADGDTKRYWFAAGLDCVQLVASFAPHVVSDTKIAVSGLVTVTWSTVPLARLLVTANWICTLVAPTLTAVGVMVRPKLTIDPVFDVATGADTPTPLTVALALPLNEYVWPSVPVMRYVHWKLATESEARNVIAAGVGPLWIVFVAVPPVVRADGVTSSRSTEPVFFTVIVTVTLAPLETLE